MPVAMSAQGMPNVTVCRSCKDALDLMANLLDHHVPQTVPPFLPIKGDDTRALRNKELDSARNPWSSWLLIATSISAGPLLSIQGNRLTSVFVMSPIHRHVPQFTVLVLPECDRLRKDLCTIRNVCLATSSQFRESCHLRGPVAKLLEGFFETDQPL